MTTVLSVGSTGTNPAETLTETPAEVLRRAKALLDDGRHWGQGAGFSDGKRCLIGAMASVPPKIDVSYRGLRLQRAYYEALHRLAAVINTEYNEMYISVFNDTPGRTWAEVEAVLDKAIVLAEEAL